MQTMQSVETSDSVCVLICSSAGDGAYLLLQQDLLGQHLLLHLLLLEGLQSLILQSTQRGRKALQLFFRFVLRVLFPSAHGRQHRYPCS